MTRGKGEKASSYVTACLKLKKMGFALDIE